VRRFAAWGRLTDPRTQVPPQGLLPHRRRRKPPYIYSDSEIERIVAQAARLPSALGLLGATFATLFGLLAASGLRLGEALTLDVPDVDLENGVLATRKGKFGKYAAPATISEWRPGKCAHGRKWAAGAR
jgi:integrase